jgi:hypothetical protein
VVKIFWVFPPTFQLKIDGKQTTFFTKNSAEKFEFSNQCVAQNGPHLSRPKTKILQDACPLLKNHCGLQISPEMSLPVGF